MVLRPAWQAAIVAAFVAMILVLGFWLVTAPRATRVRAGMNAPDFELPSASGTKGRLSTMRRAALVMVVFDATTETRYLQSLERLYRKFFSRGLVVLGVMVDAEPAKHRKRLDEIGITFTVLEDPGGKGLAEAGYGMVIPPETYLLPRGARVTMVSAETMNWQARDADKMIDDLLPQAERPGLTTTPTTLRGR